MARTSGDGSEERLVGMYLEDVGRHPLLTEAEEVRLAEEIAAGRSAAARIAAGTGLTADLCRDLLAKVHAGQQAAARFARANLRLVLSIAKKYQGRGVSFLDLVQDGNLGLLRAVERFDAGKGFRFSTYATWWIRQAILNGITTARRTVRLPAHADAKLNRLRLARNAFEERHGRPPTTAELASLLGLPRRKVDELLAHLGHPVSLSGPIGGDDQREMGETVADRVLPPPDQTVLAAALPAEVDRLLTRLTERERVVLGLRHGLDGSDPRTLEEVGRELGISQERVRQLEVRALEKLRGAVSDSQRELLTS